MQFSEHFDVVVVGAGHAGCEAAQRALQAANQSNDVNEMLKAVH
jgi:tRNA U34 5-carboxymethylaminomethyl modifying enzyme MnmG/GidA